MPQSPQASEIVTSFQDAISKDPELPNAVAAIRALMLRIRESEATTIMELRAEMYQAAEVLKAECKTQQVSLASACELFLRFVTRVDLLSVADIEECKKIIIKRGEIFARNARQSRERIAAIGGPFIRDGATILAHSSSRAVASLLLTAAKTKRFNVIVTESRPDCSGLAFARRLIAEGVPCTLVLDAAVASVMHKVDLVVTGAEGIVENGGIFNKVGTFNLALAAASINKPFYVVAESFKFTRVFPLTQEDIPLVDDITRPFQPIGSEGPVEGAQYHNPMLDYTPPAYITLLITDLGVLTPSAVSDELIKLYQ